MTNPYILTDADIMQRIANKVKGLRLKQNMSRQALAQNAGVSLSSVIRMEEGNVKSFDTLLRVLRILGKLDILLPLLEEESLSPNEYYQLVNAQKSSPRKRAAKANTKPQEETEW